MTYVLGRRLREVAIRCWEALMRGAAFQAAAAVAFWFFLSLVPLLVLAGFLIGQVARAKGVDALMVPLVDFAPESAVDLIRGELERLAGANGSSIAPLGVASFMWTASSGLHNLMDIVEQAAGTPARDWWKQRALSLGCVTLVLAAVCLAAWLLVRIGSASPEPHGSPSVAHAQQQQQHGVTSGKPNAAPSPKHRVRHVLRTAWHKAAAASIGLVLGVALLGGFYHVAVVHPRGQRRTRPVWTGTWFAVCSWIVVSWAFGTYVAQLGNYAVYYGSLAAVAVTLIWLYLTSLSLVVGAYVNAALSAPSTPAGS
jgi:membrane protein